MTKPFAVFRRDLYLFEILQPVAAKDGSIQRLAYADLPAEALGAVWSVSLGGDSTLANHDREINIKGKPVHLISTGAILTTENYPEAIPIVYCSNTRYFPSSIRGIRVTYMDDLEPDYFRKKNYGSKALAIKFRGDKAEVVEEGRLEEAGAEGAENQPNPHIPYIMGPRVPYDPEECDIVKATSCLAVFFLFFLVAYLSHQSNIRSAIRIPLNPFLETCSVDDDTFFMDIYSAYYP